MPNIKIKIDGETVLNNGIFNIANKSETSVRAIISAKKVLEDIMGDPSFIAQTVIINLERDVFPSHHTKLTVIAGHESIVPIVINIPGEEKITVAAGQTVSAVLGSLLVDAGRGTLKMFTDSSKTTEAVGGSIITSAMILEVKAQDTATTVNYIVRKQPSDITTITITNTTYVAAVNNSVGSELITVVDGSTAAQVLSSISVDGGEGTAKIFTDSSKTTQANSTDVVTAVMVLESTAENTTIIVNYDIALS